MQAKTSLSFNDKELYTDRGNGFTIVELLIVIVVIGILAAITIVAYNGITAKANIASVTSDLDNASKQIKLYQVTNGSYPTSIDCSATPAANSICLRSSAGTTYGSIVSINSTTPQTFCIAATRGSISYYTDQDRLPASGTCSTLNGLIGWWKFNGNANDTSGNGNNATVNGSLAGTGQNGQPNGSYAMATGDIYIGSPAIFNTIGSTGFTYSVWIMRTATSTQRWPIIMGGDTHVYFGIRSQNYGDSIGVEYATSPYAGSSYTNMSNGSATLGIWHLATITYDGNTLTNYFDGVKNGTATVALNSTNQGLDFQAWTGNIDDARIYNRALSATEVAQLYAMGAQ